MKKLVEKKGVEGCIFLIHSDYNNLKTQGLNIIGQIVSVEQSKDNVVFIITTILELVKNYVSGTFTSDSQLDSKKKSKYPRVYNKTPQTHQKNIHITINPLEVKTIFKITKILTESMFMTEDILQIEGKDITFVYSLLIELLVLLKGVDVEGDKEYRDILEYLYEISNRLNETQTQKKINKELYSRIIEIFDYITSGNNYLGDIIKDYICISYLFVKAEGAIFFMIFLDCNFFLFLFVEVNLYGKTIRYFWDEKIIKYVWVLLKRNSSNEYLKLAEKRMYNLLPSLILRDSKPFYYNEENIIFLMV
jgi:hypothetical protein